MHLDTDNKVYDEIPDAKLLTQTMEHYLKARLSICKSICKPFNQSINCFLIKLSHYSLSFILYLIIDDQHNLFF